MRRGSGSRAPALPTGNSTISKPGRTLRRDIFRYRTAIKIGASARLSPDSAVLSLSLSPAQGRNKGAAVRFCVNNAPPVYLIRVPVTIFQDEKKVEAVPTGVGLNSTKVKVGINGSTMR